MKLIHILLLLAVSFDVTAGAGTFPQGKNVKLLKDSLEFKTGITIGKDSVDPQSVATPADQGSLLISNDNLYLKMDDGMTTAWRPIDLPDQTNKEQHILTSDGTVASWGADLPPIIAQKYTNRNVIINSDFEDEGTDWTITGGCVASYPVTTELEKTLRLTCTASTFSVKQTSTLLVPFAGQQASFDLQVKSDTNGVKVASINNSIRNTEYSVTGDDEFKRFKQIGVIADAVNNGLEIYSDVAFTGVVDIDNTYLGLSNLTQEVSGAHFVGKIDLRNNCWYDKLTSGYGYLLDSDSTCSVPSSNITGDIALPLDSNRAGVYIKNKRTDGHYQIIYNGLMLKATAGNYCEYTMSKSSTLEDQGEIFISNTGADGSEGQLVGNFRFSNADNGEVFFITSPSVNGLSCRLYGTSTNSGAISVHFFPDDKHTIVTKDTTLTAETANEFSFEGSAAAVVSKENYDLISGNGTVPTGGRFSYTFNTGLFSSAPSCTCNAGPFGNTAADYTCSINSVSTTTLVLNMTNNGSAVNAGQSVKCSRTADVNKSQSIVGNFEQIETVTGDITAETANKLDFSFNYSAAISSNLDDVYDVVTSITNVGTSTITINMDSSLFTTKPKVTCEPHDSSGNIGEFLVYQVSTATFSIQVYNHAGAAQTFSGDIDCTITKAKADTNKSFTGAVINAADSTQLIADTVLENITSDDLISIKYTNNSTQAILSGSSLFKYATLKEDNSNGAYNPSLGRYTVPVGKAGNYIVSASISYNFNNSYVGIRFKVNGVTVEDEFRRTDTGTESFSRSSTLKLEEGDYLEIWSQSNNAGSSYGDAFYNTLSISQQPTKQSIVQSLVGEMTTSCQTKILSSNTSVGVTGVMSDLSFTLEVGKKYSIIGRLLGATGNGSSTNKQWQVTVRDGATSIDRPWVRLYPIGDALALLPVSKKFTATSTSLTFDVTAVTASEAISAGVLNSYMELCELPETTILQ